MKFPNVSGTLQFCICAMALGAVVYGQNPPTPQDNRGTPSQNPSTQSPRQAPGQSSTTPSTTRSTTSDSSTSFTTKAMEINSAEIQLGQLAVKNSQNDKVKSFAEMMVKDHTDALAKMRGASGDTRTTSLPSTTAPGNTENRTGETRANPSPSTTPNTSNRQGLGVPRSDTGDRADDRVSSTPTNLPALSKEHQQLMSRLEKKTGAQFDRDYINAMVTGHREALRMFELEAGGNSPGQSQASNAQGNTRNNSTTTTPSSSDARSSKALATSMLSTIRHHLNEAESIQKALK